MISIGEMSLRTSVKVPTIRYYEQMGLITAPETLQRKPAALLEFRAAKIVIYQTRQRSWPDD